MPPKITTKVSFFPIVEALKQNRSIPLSQDFFHLRNNGSKDMSLSSANASNGSISSHLKPRTSDLKTSTSTAEILEIDVTINKQIIRICFTDELLILMNDTPLEKYIEIPNSCILNNLSKPVNLTVNFLFSEYRKALAALNSNTPPHEQSTGYYNRDAVQPHDNYLNSRHDRVIPPGQNLLKQFAEEPQSLETSQTDILRPQNLRSFSQPKGLLNETRAVRSKSAEPIILKMRIGEKELFIHPDQSLLDLLDISHSNDLVSSRKSIEIPSECIEGRKLGDPPVKVTLEELRLIYKKALSKENSFSER